jgi:hypothetical protein
MNAFTELMAFQRDTEALGEIAGRLGWDQETMMPRGAALQRGDEMAAIEGVLHARRTDPRVGEWLAQARADDAAGQRALALIGRAYRATPASRRGWPPRSPARPAWRRASGPRPGRATMSRISCPRCARSSRSSVSRGRRWRPAGSGAMPTTRCSTSSNPA